ncbi:MAG: ABC transporter ATP-binding protein [Candidatus Aureabacteria bacterium]|nr:ABC transporter ATP-binding protein [Candidatus Auribacterota bacterium]
MPLISLNNISKSYSIDGKSLEVLKSITLDIEPGTCYAVIGPSGAGKSTLLHMMGLLDKPSAGDIYLEGKKASALSAYELARIRNRSIGFVFQNFHLIPELTALENILLPALLKKSKKIEAEKKAYSLLEKMNLKNRENHHPTQLSGGEQQRICICRALINSPRIILADEPTGNLDSQNAHAVESLLESLALEENVSLVVVTHNESLAKRANKIIALLDGKIVN